MAYTISLTSLGTSEVSDTLRARIIGGLAVDGRFTANVGGVLIDLGTRRRPFNAFFTIGNVRLVQAKPYCGQHPGECVANGRKKIVGRWLEWEDWVCFHNVVNDVLDSVDANVDVWTNPRDALDVGSKMWVRRGHARRVLWEWTETFNGRLWNHGSADQFDTSPRATALPPHDLPSQPWQPRLSSPC